MENIFVQLYPFVFLIGLAGYGPQLVKLIRDKNSADGISIPTWVIWTLSWAISFGYAVTWVHDFMLCLVAGMNLVAHSAIIGIVAYRRWEKEKSLPLEVSGVAEQVAYIPVRE